MRTPEEILQALLSSELPDDMFDGAVVDPSSGCIQLEDGTEVQVTVQITNQPVCLYPSCGDDAVRTVNGTPLCGIHAMEFEDFLRHDKASGH